MSGWFESEQVADFSEIRNHHASHAEGTRQTIIRRFRAGRGVVKIIAPKRRAAPTGSGIRVVVLVRDGSGGRVELF